MQQRGNKDILALVLELETAIKKAGTEMEGVVEPVRETVLKRYPVFFAVVVTLGVAATVLGLEQILLRIPILTEQPWLLFLLGIAILTVTGRLYQKLS